MTDLPDHVEAIENPTFGQLYADLAGTYGPVFAVPAAMVARVVGSWKRFTADEDDTVVWVLQNGGDSQ